MERLFSFHFSIDRCHAKKRIDPHLHTGMTFDTFLENEGNRLARSSGNQVAMQPGEAHHPFNPLFIYGDSGVGKTHLLHAIGHKVRQFYPKLQVLYIPMQQLMNEARTARRKRGKLASFFRYYQQIDVLLIDDMQALSDHPDELNLLFDLFRCWVHFGNQLVLASDKPFVEQQTIAEQMFRFKAGLPALITPPDLALSEQIPQAESTTERAKTNP